MHKEGAVLSALMKMCKGLSDFIAYLYQAARNVWSALASKHLFSLTKAHTRILKLVILG